MLPSSLLPVAFLLPLGKGTLGAFALFAPI